MPVVEKSGEGVTVPEPRADWQDWIESIWVARSIQGAIIVGPNRASHAPGR